MATSKPDSKPDETPVTRTTTSRSGSVDVKTLQQYDEVAVVQHGSTGEIRLMSYAEMKPHFPPRSFALPLKLEMSEADFGKLLKPDNIAKKAGLPADLHDVVNKALYRYGVFRVDSETPIPQDAIDSAGKAAYKFTHDTLKAL